MTQETQMDAAAAKKQKKQARIVIEMILGGLFGAGDMMLLAEVMPVELLDIWEFIALALATMIALVLVIILITAASRRLMIMRVFDGEADEAEIRSQRRNILYSGLSMAALIPPLTVLALPELVNRDLGMAIIVVSLMVMTGAGWVIWREQDELHRVAGLEGANVGLGVIFTGIFLWAALNILGYNVPFEPLPAVILTILATVVSSIIVAARRSLFSTSS